MIEILSLMLGLGAILAFFLSAIAIAFIAVCDYGF